MKARKLFLALLGGAIAFSGLAATAAMAQQTQFFPLFVYRTGPYAPGGIPSANGFQDYYALINKRDGGINGVRIVVEECETKYNTKIGVECYEKLKNKGSTGATLIHPFSTGITYQLIPKAAVDEVPIFSSGYGRTAAADGRVFKWIFNAPTTYWSQASAVIRYMGKNVLGGMDKLKGKKIAHIYHNTKIGVECYEKLKNKGSTGATLIHPFSTPI